MNHVIVQFTHSTSLSLHHHHHHAITINHTDKSFIGNNAQTWGCVRSLTHTHLTLFYCSNRQRAGQVWYTEREREWCTSKENNKQDEKVFTFFKSIKSVHGTKKIKTKKQIKRSACFRLHMKSQYFQLWMCPKTLLLCLRGAHPCLEDEMKFK